MWKSTAGLQLHSGGRGIYVTFAATSYDPTVKVVACLRMKKTTMASTTKPKPLSTPKGPVTPSGTSTSPQKGVASSGSQGASLQGGVASSGSQGEQISRLVVLPSRVLLMLHVQELVE